jgi:hypothetical protein
LDIQSRRSSFVINELIHYDLDGVFHASFGPYKGIRMMMMFDEEEDDDHPRLRILHPHPFPCKSPAEIVPIAFIQENIALV